MRLQIMEKQHRRFATDESGTGIGEEGVDVATMFTQGGCDGHDALGETLLGLTLFREVVLIGIRDGGAKKSRIQSYRTARKRK